MKRDVLSCEKLQPMFNPGAYTGKWYQIARIPQPFEQGCMKATAEYEIVDESTVSVLNICYTENYTPIREARGTAKIIYPNYPAALYVSFPNFPIYDNSKLSNRLVPNYLVHRTDYCKYSVVGSPDRKSLWILSRTPEMDPVLYSRLICFAASLGYNTKQVVKN